ncbi:MAG: hypothetical protein ACI88C_002037 [Acidimicrobiales bacterium]|jgi:hypothetical protein
MLPASGGVQEKTLQLQCFSNVSSLGEVVLPKVIGHLADYSLRGGRHAEGVEPRDAMIRRDERRANSEQNSNTD